MFQNMKGRPEMLYSLKWEAKSHPKKNAYLNEITVVLIFNKAVRVDIRQATDI